MIHNVYRRNIILILHIIAIKINIPEIDLTYMFAYFRKLQVILIIYINEFHFNKIIKNTNKIIC